MSHTITQWASSVSNKAFTPIQYYNFNLQTDINSGIAYLSWNTYPRTDTFRWYTLLYSNSVENPTFSWNQSFYLWDDVSKNNYNLRLNTWETQHYFRICATTETEDSFDRYCSEPSLIQSQINTQANTIPNQRGEEIWNRQVFSQARQLSLRAKNKIEDIVWDFMRKLDDIWYSGAQKIEAIDTVLEKLEEYKTTERYVVMIWYLEEILLWYKLNYSGESDFLDLLERALLDS